MKPYETIQELLEDSKIHGPYVVGRNNHIYTLVTSIMPPLTDGFDPQNAYSLPARVELGGHRHNTLSYKGLLKLYTWQDGHPCGK